MTKRTFDCVVASLGLLCLSPVFALLAIAIKLDSAGSVFFRQERVGRNFTRFSIYKFRTMVSGAPRLGRRITCGEDPRITRVGRLLRKTKLDELPQLINVLKGEMSIVGPRPEVRQYVECFRDDYEQILTVRPGITDLASLKFRDEATLLGAAPDPEDLYVRSILPEKINLEKEYIRRASIWFDLTLIAKTLAALSRMRISGQPVDPRLGDRS
jgi:lipopolysaccharide/colanic/teichoic acid biosynthesis glycosyltransferase